MVDILVTDLDERIISRIEAMAKARGLTPNDIALEAVVAYVKSEKQELKSPERR
ncbi:MAG: hypothetical protein WDN48_13950 [Pseudolabrys sp.]